MMLMALWMYRSGGLVWRPKSLKQLYSKMRNRLVQSGVQRWHHGLRHAAKVYNTEHFKSHHLRSAMERKPTGCPKTLAQLIRMGEYDPLSPGSLPMQKLRQLCDVVQIPSKSSKVCYQHIIATLTVYI